jgi:ribosomal protein S18 acetylase RimI-like enzyme
VAARLEPSLHTPNLALVDLRHLRPADLEPLLQEEESAWHNLLDWDFSKSADLVRHFVDMHSLSGCALVEGRKAAGYAYYVTEEHKGLIGDLFVRKAFSSVENEDRLLEGVLDAMMNTPPVSRVESQLMMAYAAGRRTVPWERYASRFERNFMMLNLERAELGPARRRPPAASRVYYEKWGEQYQEAAAQLIAAAYLGHVDSSINDQYRSVPGARRFLYNIVQYPGCGSFFKPASVAAFERLSGRMCGLCLASLVHSYCGHITQICVAPWAQGTGIGYELLRQSLLALGAAGCRKTSLTVTASNRAAIRLYEDVGFVTVRKFPAYVWEGF